jgi:hypothetical protein
MSRPLTHRTITRVATKRTPYGTILPDGVAKRPAQARHEFHYERGEEMVVCVNGEIMSTEGMVKVRKGKVDKQ